MRLIWSIVILIILYVIQGRIFFYFWDKGLSVKLSFKNSVSTEGEKNTLSEIITNKSFIPLPIVHIKFMTSNSFIFDDTSNSFVSDNFYRHDVFTFLEHQKITRNLDFICSRRGCYMINKANILVKNFFITETYALQVDNNAMLNVLPKKLNSKEFQCLYQNLLGDFVSKQNIYEDPFEFKGIREYMPYDNMKSINWKVSAKYSKLNVNTYYPTASSQIKILLNVLPGTYEYIDTITEESIRIASTIANNFIHNQIPVSFLSNGRDLFSKETIHIEAGQSANHMNSIDMLLSRLDTKQSPDDFINYVTNIQHENNNKIFYIIISNDVSEELMYMYKEIRDTQINCYYIVPQLKTTPFKPVDSNMIKWEL